ncbi:MAG: alanine/glycine:cation symporter family protein [Rhodothalassiaceae bacterium]
MPLRLLGLCAATTLLTLPAAAQGDGRSVSEAINAALSPIAYWADRIVFFAIPLEWLAGDGAPGMPIICIWLLGAAIFFTIRMGFVNVRGVRQSFRIVSGAYDNPRHPGEVTHFQALTAALSGTVGLGNIAGVAVAISLGGPGATFWMIVVGLFGMASKFTEVTLGLKYRQLDAKGRVSGGPMYYLRYGLAERGMVRLGQVLAATAAVFCILGAFGAGAVFQVNQASQQFVQAMAPALFGEGSFLVGRQWIIGLIYAALIGMVIIGGIRSIVKVTERLVPLMAILYMSAALVVLAIHFTEIPAAFGKIFAGAFSPEAGIGGLIGAMVWGLRRATFSNEAGVGSAAIAHAAAKTNEPVSEGLVALLEPFVDTVIVCTTTALVIIVTGQYLTAEAADGIALTSSAFESVIGWFPYILSLAVLMFAFSTSLTWFYYGERSFLYLVGRDQPIAGTAFKLVFLAVLVAGSALQLGAVVQLADATLLAMAFPNLIGVFIMSGQVKRMMDDYFARVRSGDIVPEAERAAVGQAAE